MSTQKYNKLDFSSRLRKIRGGRTQAEFAKFLGFTSQQTYQNYENGRIPKAAILQRIAQQTGVPLSWLVTGDGPSTFQLDSSETAESEGKVKEEGGVYGKSSLASGFLPLASEEAPTLLSVLTRIAVALEKIGRQGEKEEGGSQ